MNKYCLPRVFSVGASLCFALGGLLCSPGNAGTITVTIEKVPKVAEQKVQLQLGEIIRDLFNPPNLIPTPIAEDKYPIITLGSNIDTPEKKRDFILRTILSFTDPDSMKPIFLPDVTGSFQRGSGSNELVFKPTAAALKELNIGKPTLFFDQKGGETDKITMADDVEAASLSFQGIFDPVDPEENTSLFTAAVTSAIGTVAYMLKSSDLNDLNGSTITDAFLSCFMGSFCPTSPQMSLSSIGVRVFKSGQDIVFNFDPQAAAIGGVSFGTTSFDGDVIGAVGGTIPEPSSALIVVVGVAFCGVLMGTRRLCGVM